MNRVGGSVDVTDDDAIDFTEDGPKVVPAASNVAPVVNPSILFSFSFTPVPAPNGRLFGPVSSLMSINGFGIAFEFTLNLKLLVDRTEFASDWGFERFEAELPGRLGGTSFAKGALSESSESESEEIRWDVDFTGGDCEIVLEVLFEMSASLVRLAEVAVLRS
jgi:hypothetical protein